MKTINVYSFNELSESSKQKAINDYLNNDIFEYDLSFFKDDIENQLKELNIEMTDLTYSLSSSQGDGLSFTSKFDVPYYVGLCFTELSEKRKSILVDLIHTIESSKNNGSYCYASKNDVDYELNNNDLDVYKHKNIYKYINRLISYIQDVYMDLCKDFEKQGYAEIEHQSSVEYISNELIINEYDFLENGKRV